MVDAIAWLMCVISVHGALQLLLLVILSARAEEWVHGLQPSMLPAHLKEHLLADRSAGVQNMCGQIAYLLLIQSRVCE